MKTINKSTKLNYVRVIGYVFFAVTVIACAVWIMYQFYLIKGWQKVFILTNPRYEFIMSNHIPLSVIPVSLVGGAVASNKDDRFLALSICYFYLLLVVLILPMCWHIELYSLRRIIDITISYCSWYSVFIIPSFSVSCILTLGVKKLIKFLKCNCTF